MSFIPDRRYMVYVWAPESSTEFRHEISHFETLSEAQYAARHWPRQGNHIIAIYQLVETVKYEPYVPPFSPEEEFLEELDED